MKTISGPGARLLLVWLLFVQETWELFAYTSVGPLEPPRKIPHGSAAGVRTGTTSLGSSRENGPEIMSVVGPMTTRLQVLRKMAAAISLLPAAGAVAVGAGGGLAFPEEARAAKGSADAAQKEWISGKGAQPKGSDDKTGTRKESKYLRCLSNCLADCQKPTYGPERDREECLQTCQDECCMSYEQCTYTVTQNK
ncbi:unnamed protein product [Ectocarpus sp. 4 AP-2014]